MRVSGGEPYVTTSNVRRPTKIDMGGNHMKGKKHTPDQVIAKLAEGDPPSCWYRPSCCLCVNRLRAGSYGSVNFLLLGALAGLTAFAGLSILPR